MAKCLKILRVINEIGPKLPSGPPRMAYYLTAGLARKGVKTVVYTNNYAGDFQSDLVSVRVLKPRWSFGHYRLNMSMFSELAKEDVDLVHVHGYRNFESDAGAFSSFLTGRPLVITCHGTVLAPLNEVWSLGSRLLDLAYDGLTTRFTLRQADALVATSIREAEEIASLGMPKTKIKVIPNSVDLTSVQPVERISDGLVRVLLVSRLTYKNNIEMAIRGFAKAFQKDNKLRLKIVGDVSPSRFVEQERDYKEKLLFLCKQLGLNENQVEFAGWLTGEALWNAYSNSDIFLWTSRYDNFAHALVEAAHFSLPIVSTDVGVASELIGHNEEGGFIVRQEDVDGASSALITLAEKHDLRRDMGQQNRLASMKFTVENMVESYIKIYSRLI